MEKGILNLLNKLICTNYYFINYYFMQVNYNYFTYVWRLESYTFSLQTCKFCFLLSYPFVLRVLPTVYNWTIIVQLHFSVFFFCYALSRPVPRTIYLLTKTVWYRNKVILWKITKFMKYYVWWLSNICIVNIDKTTSLYN